VCSHTHSSHAEPAWAIRVRDLQKAYGKSDAVVRALCGVTLDIEPGARVALLGKSGSGKSTLLNLLGGLDRPTSGELKVAGRDLGQLKERELARFRSRAVGMIFQSFNLIPSRTAVQNVELPMIFSGQSPRERFAEARRALERVGLGARLHHRPAELSGGESQRVAIARALVNRPQVLLADEPTGNLDSATAAEVMTLIAEHVREYAMTLILVTHDEDVARAFTERVIRLRDGQLIP
jgi:predicted ABC-type transport system involved in lysophospholipase L1 biosynthesis ATPase subunit